MIKKVLCLALVAIMLCSAVLLTGCEGSNKVSSTERLPRTISVLGITSEETTPEAVKKVENAINSIMGATYSTHIDLTLVTPDEYYDVIKDRVELAQYNTNLDKAVNKYNTAALSQATSSTIYKSFGKWKFKVSSLAATTVTTRSEYSEVVTRINEQGIIEVVYPEAKSPIDVVMIIGQDMYDTLDGDGVLKSIESDLNTETYTKFKQYIYPTYFELLKAITGDIKAIPNNNLLAEYTYLVVDKKLAEKYDFDVESVSTYGDLSEFLAEVKANEDVIPMNTVPDALGIFRLFDDDDIAIGTYCDPMLGYNPEENSSYSIKNLFEIPQYISHISTMEEYKNAGYFTSESGSTDFAVDVVKGDASIAAIYGDDYDVKILQNPFVEDEAVFNGMLAVSEYTSDMTRSLEFILELTTNPEIKNLFQYGIEGVNYTVNNDGTITRLNHDYMMDNGTTGNVYMGYPEEGMLPDQWKYVKSTNLESLTSPYLSYYTTATGSFKSIYYVNDAILDDILSTAMKRAIINETYAALGSEYTYDYYLTTVGTGNESRVGNVIKQAADYKDYFIDCIISDANVTEAQATSLFNATSVGAGAKYPYDWYFTKLTELVVAEKYSNLYTASGLDTAVKEKIASLAGTLLDTYTSATNSAKAYYTNIETLKMMTRLVIWEDLSDEEWEVYRNMGVTEFETLVFNYVRDNYIKENNITEDTYDELVKALMMSVMEFTDPADGTTQYTLSWDDYAKAKEDAQYFFDVIAQLKDRYYDRLADYYGMAFIYLSSDEKIPDQVHDMLYDQWLKNNGYTKADFENELYDEIVEFLGINYSTLVTTRRTNTTLFADYMTRIKNQYKNVLVEAYSLEQFKNDKISNDNVLSTLLADKIEEKTGIYASMCAELGIDYSEYVDGVNAFTTFARNANKLRTEFIYTLRTVYTQNEINAFDYNDIDGIVYDVISESGFYTSEMSALISSNLNAYMRDKSAAKDYMALLNKLASVLEDDINAAGYTADEVNAMSIADAADVIYGVVEEKYFSDAITVEEMLASISGEYVNGIKDAEAPDAYADDAAKALNSNGMFSSFVYYLNKALSDARAEVEG